MHTSHITTNVLVQYDEESSAFLKCRDINVRNEIWAFAAQTKDPTTHLDEQVKANPGPE
jgi:hypothetical protein